MADANNPQIKITASLEDLASAALAKLEQRVQAFAGVAPKGADELGTSATELARDADQAAQRLVAASKIVIDALAKLEAARASAGSGSGTGSTGTQAPAALPAVVEESTVELEANAQAARAASEAIDQYIRNLGLERAAQNLSAEERQKATAILRAQLIAEQGGIQVSAEQRASIERLVASFQDLGAEQQSIAQLEAVVARETARNTTEREREAAILKSARADLERFTKSLTDERALVRLDSNERELAIRLRQAEDLAIRGQIPDREKLLATIRQEVLLTQQARAAANTGNGGINARGISGSLIGLQSIIPGGGGQLGQVAIQATAGANAVEGLGAAAGLTAGSLGALAAAGAVAAGEIGFLVAAAESSIKLTEALKPIAVVSQAGADGLSSLRTQIREIATESGRTQEEIAGAAKVLKDIDPSRQAQFLRESTDLARAGLTTVGSAAESLDRIFDAFGGSLDKARARAAQLFVAARAGESEIAPFAQAIANLGPVAQQLGLNFDDLLKPLAGISKATNSVAQGSTALQTILGQLADPASALSSALRDIGVQAGITALQTRGVDAVFQDVGKALAGRPDLATQIFGNPRTARAAFAALQDSGNEALAIVSDETKAIGELTAAIQRADTATTAWSRVFEKLKDASGFNLVGAGVERVIGALGKGLDDLLGKDADALNAIGALSGGALGLFEFVKERQEKQIADAKAAGEKQKTDAIASAKATADAVLKAQADAIAKATPLPLKIRIDAAELERSIDDAVRNLQSVRNGPLDDLTSEAIGALAKPGISQADRAAAVKVINDKANALRAVRDLETKLSTETLTGTQKEIAARREVRAQIDHVIDGLRTEESTRERLRDLAGKLGDERDSQGQIDAESRLARLHQDALAAQIEEAKQSELILRATGDVSRAEALRLAIEQESAILANDRAEFDVRAAEQSQKGNAAEIQAINAANDARTRARGIELSVTAAVRARAQEERNLTSALSIAASRASLGTGFDADLAQIHQRGEQERAAALKTFEDIKRAAGTTAEDIGNAARVLAASSESSFSRESRDAALATSQRDFAIRQQLGQLEQDSAQTSTEQLATQRLLLGIDRERVLLELQRKGATEEQIQRARLSFDTADTKREFEAQLQRTFGSSDPIEIALKPRLDLDASLVDAQVRQSAEQLLVPIREEFAKGVPPDKIIADLQALGAELDRIKRKAEESGNSIGEGFLKRVHDMTREFATDAQLGAQLADGAFSALQSNVADGLTTLENNLARGKASLGDFAAALARSIQQAINQIIAFKIASSIFGLFAGGGGAASSFGAQGAGGIFPGTVPSAKGNIFTNGELVPFARGGIINGPTLFPLADGRTGLAGEAGTEGIFRLRRDSQGELGIKGTVPNQSPSQSLTINVPMTINVSAIDMRSGMEFVHSQSKAIGDVVAGQIISRQNDALARAVGAKT